MNFHHLQYFWAVAKNGNLTQTAKQLRVAPSALSAQIRQLEEQLGQALFSREGRRLVLTEAGSMALAYADSIFESGRELVATLQQGRRRKHTLRIGAVATLSRNLQLRFIQPLLGRADLHLRLTSGGFEDLLSQLEQHELDVVLSTQPAASTERHRFRSRRLARQSVSIVHAGHRRRERFRFPADFHEKKMVLPGPESDLRMAFDALCERRGIRVRVLAEVDDMAMMRLLARDTDGFVLVPSIVVHDELARGLVHEVCIVPELSESFYATTVDRQFQHPLLHALLDRNESDLLAPGGSE